MTNCPLATMGNHRRCSVSLIFLLLAISSSSAWACFDCRAAVEAKVYGPGFAVNLLALLLPLVILAMVGVVAWYSDAILQKLRKERQHEQ